MTHINEVYEFASAAAAQNILSNPEYLASGTRNTGHLPGIALQAVENAVLRNLSRFCRGVAQFIAERYPDGVVDDGDTAKIVAGLSAAILGLVEEKISIEQATTTVAGILKLASQEAAIAGVDGGAITPETLHGAIAGVVRGYTRQQYATAVVRNGVSGAQAVELAKHQLLFINASGPLVISDPTDMVQGETCVLLLYSPTAQTVSWASAWHGTSLVGLPTLLTAGKLMMLSFLCVTTPAGTYMVPFGAGQEA